MIKLAARLQSPEPPRVTREGIFPGPVEPGKDYAGICEVSLLSAQVAAWEVEDTEARLAIAAGWFAVHGADDARYGKAVRRQRALEAQRWCQQRMAWTACCALYQALQLMPPLPDRDTWICEHADQMDGSTFETVWASVMGERSLPVGLSYPPSKNGHEYFLPFAPWQQSELSERREQQRKRGKRKKGITDAT